MALQLIFHLMFLFKDCHKSQHGVPTLKDSHAKEFLYETTNSMDKFSLAPLLWPINNCQLAEI